MFLDNIKYCIVNFSDEKYRLGQERLHKSLITNNFKGDIFLFKEYSEVGSKTHTEVPYQFKVYSIKKVRDMGYDLILYCDSSLFAIKDLNICFEHILDSGYLLEMNSGNVGIFSTDLCLDEFGLNRKEAFKIRLHSAGFTGLNFKNELANKFFEIWYQYAEKELTFKGDWDNKNLKCSKDELCKGHRHDQTVASIIAHKLNMLRVNPTFMQYEFNNNDKLEYASIDDLCNVILSNNKKETTTFICNGIC